MNNPNKVRYPEFLTGQSSSGVSDAYCVVQHILVQPLSERDSISKQLTRESRITDVIDQMFSRHSRLQLVLAGWIDQAVLEVRRCLQGDVRCLPLMFNELDLYRADQNGDICFYLADIPHSEVLAMEVSFEDRTIVTRQYRRANNADQSCDSGSYKSRHHVARAAEDSSAAN